MITSSAKSTKNDRIKTPDKDISIMAVLSKLGGIFLATLVDLTVNNKYVKMNSAKIRVLS